MTWSKENVLAQLAAYPARHGRRSNEDAEIDDLDDDQRNPFVSGDKPLRSAAGLGDQRGLRVPLLGLGVRRAASFRSRAARGGLGLLARLPLRDRVHLGAVCRAARQNQARDAGAYSLK